MKTTRTVPPSEADELLDPLPSDGGEGGGIPRLGHFAFFRGVR